MLLKEYVQKHSPNPENYATNFEVAEVPLPALRPNELLVKIECSAINPSDLSHLRGTYNRYVHLLPPQVISITQPQYVPLPLQLCSAQREKLPCQLGFEASGTVVKTGGGFISSLLLGKRVGCVTSEGRFWAEYAVVKPERCIILPSTSSFEEGTWFAPPTLP
jgi:NADPH:quinone reductase-like Zn-dependent oxidoreductase